MIKAIIIDDESGARKTLKALLKNYCPQVEIIGESDGYSNGLELLSGIKPDVLFLDIQMPDGSGFKLLESLGPPTYPVIFTTAYDQYAIKAIKVSALDYILKPINPTELIQAVDKIYSLSETSDINSQMKVLLDNLKSHEQDKKIVFNTSEGMHVIEIKNIIRCQSDDYYTHVHFVNGKDLLISKTLKDTESIISSESFYRVHKSHLVNLKHIKQFIKTDGGYLLLSNQEKIPVSRRRKDEIIKALNAL